MAIGSVLRVLQPTNSTGALLAPAGDRSVRLKKKCSIR